MSHDRRHGTGRLRKRMMRALYSLLLVIATNCAMAADRPNVIVIMADDIGAEGLGCYGSTIYTTPNLDRMASEGLRFNNAYATPLCTPTRVMIMSGLYPNRTGFQGLMGKREDARMPATIKTFGHYFHDAGYQTPIIPGTTASTSGCPSPTISTWTH